MFGICVQMAIYFLQIHTEKLYWANNYYILNFLVNILYIVSLSIVFEIITKILIMVII